MKRAVEVPLVLVIATLTVTASATAIRDASHGKTDPILRDVKAVARTVSQWFPTSNKPAVLEKGSAGQKGLHSEPNNTVSHTDRESLAAHPTPSTPFQGWSQEDVSELESILRKLTTSVPSDSLKAVYQSLAENNQTAAKEEIVKLVESKLSATDDIWISQHFRGSAAFNDEDIQLLSQSLNQVVHDLTPEERQMASENLSTMFATSTPSPSK